MPSRADRLAQIRALRAAGKTGFDAYEVQDAESIYETVDDEAYKKVVRSESEEDLPKHSKACKTCLGHSC